MGKYPVDLPPATIRQLMGIRLEILGTQRVLQFPAIVDHRRQWGANRFAVHRFERLRPAIVAMKIEMNTIPEFMPAGV
jgi:hypothetical protein